MSDDLPMGWSSVSIADIGEVVTGNTPATKQRELFYGGNIPFVKPPDLDAGEFLVFANETLSHEGSLQSRLLPPDSILINCIGNIGKVAFSRVACCTNQQINSIVPNTQLVEPKFVYWSILSPRFQELLQSNSSATTVSIINKGRFSALEIPIPPINEQRRIVDKLDRIGDRNRMARNELSHIPKLIARYKQAVLAAACSGKLTEDWREKNLTIKNLTILPQKDETSINSFLESLEDIPDEWLWKTIGQIAEITGGLTKNQNRAKCEKQVPYLRVANVYANELRLDDISEIGINETEWNRVKLKKDDLLIVEGNGSIDQVGRVALWDGSIDPCVHQNHLIKMRVSSLVLSKFALYWLLSPSGRNAIMQVASSSSGLHTLSISKISALPIPLCSIEEQKEIVRRVEKMFEKIDMMEQEYQKAAKLCDRLEQATLAKAFRGELVPQDPNDAPASVLLEQVKREKEKGKMGK